MVATADKIISTHDLTRRSTLVSVKSMPAVTSFQLTTSRGGRRSMVITEINTLTFQLTTSRGGRPTGQRTRKYGYTISTHDLTRRSTDYKLPSGDKLSFQLTTSRGGRQQFLRKKFSFLNHFLCLLHIIYSYYINTIFFSTLFFAKSSFFLVRIP